MKEALSIFRWLFIILFWGLLGFVTCWFIFPIAWLLRDFKYNPFWLWLDDTIYNDTTPSGYAEDYRVWCRVKGYKIGSFKAMYMWHCDRNRMWNLIEMFKVPNGDPEMGNQDIKVISYWVDNLHKHDGTRYHQDGMYVIVAGLKYIGDIGEDPWQVNQGEIISSHTSFFGAGGMFYRVGNWVSFRYSHCIPFLWWWWTFKFGTNASRYFWSVKFQLKKPIV